MLQYLPMNHPDRPRFEQLFKDMAGKILSLQQPDGLWRASLLDPEDFPMPEASGSAMFTYGLAWGVNQGLLDRANFEPAVRKAWPALVGCVDADGKLDAHSTRWRPSGEIRGRFNRSLTAAASFCSRAARFIGWRFWKTAKPIWRVKVTPIRRTFRQRF